MKQTKIFSHPSFYLTGNFFLRNGGLIGNCNFSAIWYNSKMQKWILVIGVIGASIVGIVALIIWKDTGAPSVGQVSLVLAATDQLKGNRDASVTLVEYSDFQCPACKAWHPVLKDITRDYADRIRFVYRHFPLSQHKQAELAAYAAEAAGVQGKFWEMHDMIFERQSDWAENSSARSIFLDMARLLNLDMAAFERDLDSDVLHKKVSNDLSGGLKANVNATPTFFLDGRKIQPRSPDELKQLLDDALRS